MTTEAGSNAEFEGPADLIDETAGTETEEDAGPIPAASLREAFVTSSDWTTATIVDQMRRGNIELNPRFQRREVWQPQRKSRFIESLLLGLPVPQVVLAEARDQRGRYLVLDGKQRLLAIRQFCANPGEVEVDKPFKRMPLKGLELRRDLEGMSRTDLEDEPGFADDRDAFDNSTVRAVVVRNWPSEEYLFRVFLRLNAGSVALSPQELRQALMPGPFVDFVDERAVDSTPLRTALNQSGPDFRMRDTEVLLRALAFQIRGHDYSGNLKLFLDSTCEALNAAWPTMKSKILAGTDRIEDAIALSIDIFGQRIAFSRYTDGLPERRFNRAIFDVMVHSLAQPQVAVAANQNPGAVRDTLMALCANDTAFTESVTSTTKSLGATAYRFVAWADALGSSLGVAVEVPPGYRERVSSI